MKNSFSNYQKFFLFTLIIGFLPLFAFSQIPVLSDQAKFSILTVDVANESHTLYGHTALRVQDTTSNFDVVYNYGMFDFRTDNFLLKFTKGDLQYYAAVYPYADFEYSYQEENRSFYEQELNLSQSEKKELFDKLNKSVFSEDKFYTYKFIDRNCTTKVIDIVNSVLDDRPIKNCLHQNQSYREVLFPYQKDHYFLNLGINIIFGHRPDEQASVLFLPLDFMKVLENTKHHKMPLATKPKTLFKAVESNPSFHFFDSIYFLGLIMVLILFLNKKILNIVFFSLTGLIGVLFVAVNLYSLHQEVLWNYNLLLFNPIHLALVYFLIQKNNVWIKRISLLSVLFLASYFCYMFTKIHLGIVWPILLTASVQLIRIMWQTK